MKTWNWIRTAGVLCCAFAIGAGCASDTLDEGAITSRLQGFDTSGEFTLVNSTPLTSQHLADTVNIWVSAEGLETYLGVDPDDATDSVDAFPNATMIVKEQLDDTGARTMLTVMVKGAVGGDPETADWWWGIYSASELFQQGGSIGFCIDCHEGNGLERTDWVQGVALDER